MTPKEIAERLRRCCHYENINSEVKQLQSSATNGLVLAAAELIDRLTAPASEGEVEEIAAVIAKAEGAWQTGESHRASARRIIALGYCKSWKSA